MALEESIWGEGFETEINNHLYNIRGALSMARSQDPNSNGSQFFIVQNTDDMHDGLLKTTILKQSSTLIKTAVILH